MRISELSRRSGVPVATIKYYIREGMLPPGRATSATQAEYGDQHVRRLRLVRALIGVRGLSVSATREVLRAVSAHESDLHEVLGLVLGGRPATDRSCGGNGDGAADAKAGDSASEPTGSTPDAADSTPETAGSAPADAAGGGDRAAEPTEADTLIAEMGWRVSDGAPGRGVIDETLDTLRSLGMDYHWRTLVPYAELAERAAVLDLDELQHSTDPIEQAERAVVLTILLEPALLALRRLAQENESAKRNGD
ncbi:MerR family transcriptional regulator [Streptomyces sp. AM 4-1-1]|uniref:MerR family transcriptional regulator n=1 Tax=Streptomyces sp. AM 4-1-1 TaxID=3028710 RepID=UPI0023B9243A|nr:MerR family transcriptional regulator [Streptomyces sp. AM 4-1-1]WEH34186.1 MerR family transcriptional regulator [Streptomyces sp. AM 4-1-1]